MTRKLPDPAELVALFNGGQYAKVIDGALQLVARDPGHVFANSALGAALCALGRYDEALAPLRRVLERDPGNAEILTNLGRAHEGMQDLARAEQYYRQALGRRPDFPFALNNLGNVLKSTGRNAEALALFQRLVELQPEAAEFRCNYGAALIVAERAGEAVPHLREATRLAPAFTTAWVNLGDALRRSGDPAAAIDACREAVRLQPSLAEAHFNLGQALREAERFDEAREALREAGEKAPNRPGYLVPLGQILLQQDRGGEALAVAERILALAPEDDEGRMLRFNVLARRGDYRQAWRDYEARLVKRLPIDWSRLPPRWTGSHADLAGRPLLLVAEQGLGDFLQCLRFVPALAAHCGRLGAIVPVALQGLVARCFPQLEVVAEGDAVGRGFAASLPIMSVPGLIGFDPLATPCRAPYIVVEAAAAASGRPRVGLAWAGNPDYRNDRWRSVPFAHLRPLVDAFAFDWISLQKRVPDGEREAVAACPALSQREIEACGDFLDTARLIDGLDLVVCVDTAVAHLAGAMGKPVCLLNRSGGDWRWLRGRDDTPWYPAMRIFTQATLGDWSSVVEAVRGECAKLATTRSAA